MNGNDLNKQFEALKRQVTDLVRDLHARKLAVPAGAILVAILAAMVLLPKGSNPPPAPATTSITPETKNKVQVAAQISMIQPVRLGGDTTIVNHEVTPGDVALTSSADPFTGSTGYNCTTVTKDPLVLDCVVSDIMVRVFCEEQATGACAAAEGGGASAATGGGATGAGGGSGDGGTTPSGGGSTGGTGSGGDGSGGDGGGTKYFYFAATMKLDDTTYKKVPAGTEIPKSSSPLVAFIGASSDTSSGTFVAAQGVTVSGVSIDPLFQAFVLDIGQSVTLTDPEGKDHKFTLKAIDLVEQK